MPKAPSPIISVEKFLVALIMVAKSSAKQKQQPD
jgi:hypothetical protein